VSTHPAVAGFDRGAGDYEKGRPGYPAPAIEWLADALLLARGSTVVDLAAGTGKLTRELLSTGARVVAVEPIAGMRDVLAVTVPQAELLEGTAEQIPLPTAAADAVTVGQAFHWFRGEEALAEIHRVLRPRGRLGLIWNRRDLAQPLQAQLQELFARYRGGTPSHYSGRWKAVFATTDLFGPLTVAHFPMEQVLDRQQLVARALSVSFIAQLPVAEQEQVAREVADLAGGQDDAVVLHHVTEAYWCEAVDGRLPG
jgi:SAM-dependent methyltransferase